MPNGLRNIPLQELGGTVGATLRQRTPGKVRDVVQRGQQLGRAAGVVGRGALTPDREAQLARQTAGSQTTPSQLRPQPQAPAQRLGEQAVAGIEGVRERLRPPGVQEQLPSMMPALQQAQSRGQELVQKFVTEGSKLFGQPTRARISQAFGNISPLYRGVTKDSKHVGVDIAIGAGTPLQLPVSGKVTAGIDPRGFGAYVRVLGEDGTEFRFSHLSEIAPQIIEAARTGARVSAGTLFGKSGGTPGTQGAGRTTGAHLDITAKQGGKFVDPMRIASVREALQ